MGKREALANAFILYAPFAIGFILGLFTVNASLEPVGFAWFTLGLYAAGFLLFLAAKFSLLRRGIRFSFGSKHMSRWNRRAYRAGYSLMLLGCIAALCFFLVPAANPPS